MRGLVEEKDFVGLAGGGGGGDDVAAPAEVEEEVEVEEEELELGLSLGAKRATAGSGKAGAWGEYCRILTAKDFPAAMAGGGSRASPLSSSSSVSSSSGGIKRAADSGNPPSQVVVGWPPIRAFRMNSLVNQSKDNTSDGETTTMKKSNHNGSGNTEGIVSKDQEKKGGHVGSSRFVKVNMDGDPIGRKVDLIAHASYETLALALEIMFHKPGTGLSTSAHSTKASKLLDGSSDFALTYEDKDGDWMLVGDVPWGMFLDTVKRLRIMRTSEASGLAPRFQSSTGGLIRNKPV